MSALAPVVRLVRRSSGPRGVGKLPLFVCMLAAVAFSSRAWADNPAVEVNDVTFEIGFAKYSAKLVELRGSNLSGAEFKELLTELSKGVSAEALAKLSAESITIPDLALEETIAGNHQLAHYLDVKLTGIQAGKVAAYSVASGALGSDLANGQTMVGTMRGMGGTDVDLPAIARVFAGASSDPAAPQVPLYGTSFADGFEFKMSHADISVGKTTVDDIRGRPLAKPLTEILDKLPKPHAPGEPLSPEDQKAAVGFLPDILDLYAAFSIGKMDMRDFKMTLHGDKDLPIPTVSIALSRYAMTDYANSRIGELAIEGLDIAPPNGKFHLGNFSLKGLEFREALAGMSTLMKKQASQPPGAPPSPEDVRLVKMPKFDGLSFADVNADFAMPPQPGQADTAAEPLRFSIANFDLKPEFWPDGLPKSLSGGLDHLTFSPPPSVPDGDILTAAGFDQFDVSSKVEAQWDEPGQKLTIGTAHLEGKDLGSQTAAATIDNVASDAFSSDPLARQTAWLGALIKSARVSLENKKFFDLMIAYQARHANKPVAEFRSDFVAGVSAALPALLGDSPAAKTLGEAVTTFLNDPKSLDVAFTSKEGIGALDAVMPDQILDKVDLTATANQ